jgi:hypothetical protein
MVTHLHVPQPVLDRIAVHLLSCAPAPLPSSVRGPCNGTRSTLSPAMITVSSRLAIVYDLGDLATVCDGIVRNAYDV